MSEQYSVFGIQYSVSLGPITEFEKLYNSFIRNTVYKILNTANGGTP